MEKREWHQSDLCLSQMCGEAFRRKVIEGERGVLSCSLVGGIALHEGRAVNLSQKIESHVDLAVGSVTDATRDAVVRSFSEGDVEPDEEMEGLGKAAICGQVIDRSVRMIQADYEHHQKHIKPVAVEIGIGITLADYPFDIGMKIDVVEVGDVIRDAKTSKRKPADNVAEMSQQLSLYSMGHEALYGRPCRSMQLDYIVPQKTQVQCLTYATVPNRYNQQAVLNRIYMAQLGVEKGIFPPCDPGHWKCSPKYCEFFHTCKYALRESDRRAKAAS